MGWLFGYEWHTKRDVIEHLKRDMGERLVASAVVGNELWMVIEEWRGESASPTAPRTVIVLCLLEKQGTWGYKDMSEGMHPYYYSCPLRFLDLAPVANEEWRAKVRAYHAARTAKSAPAKAAKPGDRVQLRAGCIPPWVTVLEKRGSALLGRGDDGRTYKVPGKYVESIVAAA